MDKSSTSMFIIQKWSLLRLYETQKNLKVFAKQRGNGEPYSWRLYVQIDGHPMPGVFSTDTRKTREWRTLDSVVRFIHSTLPGIKYFEVIVANEDGDKHGNKDKREPSLSEFALHG